MTETKPVPQLTPAIFIGNEERKKGDSLAEEIEKRRIEKKRRYQ